MRSYFINISRDPNGVYIGCTAKFDLYWWSAQQGIWFLIDPDSYGTKGN